VRPADPRRRPRPGLVHVALNYVLRAGQRFRKDTKSNQDRWLAIDPDTCRLIANYLDEIRAAFAAVGVESRIDGGYRLFSVPLTRITSVPECAVSSVGFLWGPAAVSRTCGFPVGLAEAPDS